MARVSVLGVLVLENPSPFSHPLRFQVQFECGEALPHDLEWKIIYVGSAESEEYDQVLDSVLVGPVPAGRHMFVFEIKNCIEVTQYAYILKVLLGQLMQTSLEGIQIRSQDLSLVIRTVSQTLPGHLVAWDFVKENWEQLIRKFHSGSFTIQNIVTSTTHQFSTEEHLREVKAFFESKSEETAQLQCVREAIEIILLNIQWMDINLVNLEKLLL